MHVPLDRSTLPGIEEHLGPTEQLLVGVRGAGRRGDQVARRAKVFGVLVFASVAAAIFVEPGFTVVTMALIVGAILSARHYAVVLTDVSALVVSLSPRGKVLKVTRFERDAFPVARAWSKNDKTHLRIELEPALTISNPKLLDRNHSYDALLGPLGVDTSQVSVYRSPRTRKQQRNG